MSGVQVCMLQSNQQCWHCRSGFAPGARNTEGTRPYERNCGQ